jgi:hypothetical protein
VGRSAPSQLKVWRRTTTTLVLAANIIMLGVSPAAAGESPQAHRAAIETAENQCGKLALQICASMLDAPFRNAVIGGIPPNGRNPDGETLATLTVAATDLGFSTVLAQWHSDPIILARTPTILAVKRDGEPHFIVATAADRARLFIVDFPFAGWVPSVELRRTYQWEGYALHCTDSSTSTCLLFGLLYRQQIVVTVAAAILAFVGYSKIRRTRFLGSAASAVRCAVVGSCCLCTVLSGCGTHTTDRGAAGVRMEPSNLLLSVGVGDCIDGECTAVLSIVNETASSIIVREITASCSCTLLSTPSNRQILAGDRMTIPVKVHMPEKGENVTAVHATVFDGTVNKLVSSTITMKGKPISVPSILDCPSDLEIRSDDERPATALLCVRTYESRNSDTWLESIRIENCTGGVEKVAVNERKTPNPNVVERAYSFRVTVEPGTLPVCGARLVLVTASHKSPVNPIDVRVTRVYQMRSIPAEVVLPISSTVVDGKARSVRILFDDKDFVPVSIDARTEAAWLDVVAAEITHDRRAPEGRISLRLSSTTEPDGRMQRTTVNVNAVANDGRRLKGVIGVTCDSRR